MQRLQIHVDQFGHSQFQGLTPEALNLVGERVQGAASLRIVDGPRRFDTAPTDRPALAVMLSGVHDYGTSEGERRLFPGDVIVIDDRGADGHSLTTIGADRAISLIFPLGEE